MAIHPTEFDPSKFIEQPHDVINSYFNGHHLQRLVEHQLTSYDDFINLQIHRTIRMFNPIRVCSDHDLDKGLNKYKLEIFITCDNLTIQRPQIHEINGSSKIMLPQEARNRNFMYAGDMTIDMGFRFVVRSGAALESVSILNHTLPNINIGKMPIMVGSSICILKSLADVNIENKGECRLDTGGYFIINGSEKTCIGQERAAENIIQCFNVSKSNPKWTWGADIKSIPDSKCISPKQLSMTISAKNSGMGGNGIWIQIPRLKNPIPLFVIFRAMNVISDKEICDYITLDASNEDNSVILNALMGSIIDSNSFMTHECAMKHIINNVMFTPHPGTPKDVGATIKHKFATDVIAGDIFPHCNTTKQKICFLGYMANHLIKCSLGIEPASDRDAFNNKRIDLTGTLLNNLFRNYYNKMIKEVQKQTGREINNGSWRSTRDYVSIITMTNIYKIVRPSTIENGLKRALSTGDFGVKQTTTNNLKVGVAQVLNRLTYVSALSHLRRINTPIDKNGKLIPPRKLHPTSWGFLCPAETPEGGSVGVVKNMAYMAQVTINSSSTPLYEFVGPYISLIDTLDIKEALNKTKVYINGVWVGITLESVKLYNSLKGKKHRGIINIFTSIVFDIRRNEIRVCSDAGRIIRPVFRVHDNKLLITPDIIARLNNNSLTWDDLFTNNLIPVSVLEYIDASEQNASRIAMNILELGNDLVRFTHCEIHPSTIFGILASCIPFPENNQSPRNTYQSAMGKQAQGWPATNFDLRMDRTAYVLTYPSRPLVDTRLMDMIGLHSHPSGSQIIVAIMTHTGYNQEDSILFNKGSVDRGLFQATIYHTEKDEDKKIHGDEELRCKPDPLKTKGMKFGNYDKLNSLGVIPENTLVENRDIIISKVHPIKEARNDPSKRIKFSDQSKIYRTSEETYIDKNYMDRNGDGYSFCKVRLRTVRKPNIGDKFSSRHGQKGTIGNIIPEHDMPFMANGVKPDIIINPHAIPSRMTIAQLKETLLGKILLELGMFGDGTSFGTLSVNEIRTELHRIGYESNGNELLYNGQTGEQLESSVFVGPVFYQRLKHMVADKNHSRSSGPMVNMTRQPQEGRSNDGGLRFGEMERDCMCSHGASRFTKERIYDVSDAFSVHVCKRCGLIAVYNDKFNIHMCKTCENAVDFDYVELPYACKLLFQELITMNVAPRILT